MDADGGSASSREMLYREKRKPTLKFGVGWENNDISKNLMLFT